MQTVILHSHMAWEKGEMVLRGDIEDVVMVVLAEVSLEAVVVEDLRGRKGKRKGWWRWVGLIGVVGGWVLVVETWREEDFRDLAHVWRRRRRQVVAVVVVWL